MDKEHKSKSSRTKQGLSRRGFMSTVGAGAIAAAAASTATAGLAQEVKSAGELVEVILDVNGRRRKVLVEPRWTLLYVLRDVFGLMGTKPGCERGECGACTVIIDELPRYSCMTLAVEAEGRKITTLEGLMDGEKLGAVQQAFAEEDAFQCGFCTPGQIMAVEGLLRANPDPSLDEIRMGVSGNLCRCGAYQHIFSAAKKASELKRKGGA
ncbi:MAG TPA: (2Fe-2S)-binding protein [Acidobacteriota bacterium]|nr:(2Fe-2S)-binding protein [Acidobacteriota bacterium]